MTTFNINSWITDIKGAFISTLEESDEPMSYIDIAKKIDLKKHGGRMRGLRAASRISFSHIVHS